MPRSASQPQDNALQGNLFGAPEPAANRNGSAQLVEPAGDLSDAELGADAAARPRQRREAAEANHGPPAEADSQADASDEPAWAHHSSVDPLRLTPMLRHYVELKAAHPERVLLYRFATSNASRMRSNSPGCWSSPSPARRGKAIGRVPMAGIPHHAAERYCAELIRQGYSAALCDSRRAPPRAPCSSATSPGYSPRHRAGRGDAQRLPQQLAGGRGGTGPSNSPSAGAWPAPM